MKVFHAHGFVVHSDNYTDGKEDWNEQSNFSEVFFDFKKAGCFLVEQFEERLKRIHAADKMFVGLSEEDRDINHAGPSWRSEYIEEYIFYDLVISEIDSARAEKADNFSAPSRIDHHIRYNGEARTSYYVFGDREYEFRSGDSLPNAGKKYAVGNLVVVSDRELLREYPSVYIVASTPNKPADKKMPWENLYGLIGISDDYRRGGRVESFELHEDDIKLCEAKRLDCHPYKEPLEALTRIVKGEVDIPPDLKEKIFKGRVLFNALPSWRDIPELYKKERV